MSRGSKAEGSFLGKQLKDITERLDHLEKKMLDLTPEGSRRVLDRMHELESVTRTQCNDLLRILHEKGDLIDKTYKRCELLVEEAEAKCCNMEHQLQRRGDRERKETTDVHNELRAYMTVIDQKASTAVAELEDKLQRTTLQVSSLDATVSEVQELCERAEAAAAQAQLSADEARKWQPADWMTATELKEEVITRAQSLQPGVRQQGQIAWCIHMAQHAASLSPRRQRALSSSRASLVGANWSMGSPRESRLRARGRSSGPMPDP